MSRILLIHEALGSSRQFSGLTEILKKEHEVFSPDLPGHGGTIIDDTVYSMKFFAEAMLEYLNRNNIDRINIFGYSLGGYVGLLMANLYPERVDKVFAFGVSFDWNETTSAEKTSKLNPETIEEKVPRYAKELAERHAPQDWKKLVRKTAEYMKNLGKDKELYDEDLAELNIPVMLGIGDKDKLASIENNVRVYRMLKKGQLTVFPDTYHQPEKIDMNRLVYEINRFFDERYK